jgi:hypothetical protein
MKAGVKRVAVVVTLGPDGTQRASKSVRDWGWS